jgi:hypothetical protein
VFVPAVSLAHTVARVWRFSIEFHFSPKPNSLSSLAMRQLRHV